MKGTEMWEPVITENQDFAALTLDEVIYQAIGAASMCWEHVERAGVFDDQKAREVAEGLMYQLFLRDPENGPVPG